MTIMETQSVSIEDELDLREKIFEELFPRLGSEGDSQGGFAKWGFSPLQTPSGVIVFP